MRHRNNCPAFAASSQMTGLMAVVASGAMHITEGMRRAGAEAREASVHQAYADSLKQAQTYAYEVAYLAESAIARVRELEAEVTRLTNACRQRQAVIDAMRVAA
jgi:hypothetical protein